MITYSFGFSWVNIFGGGCNDVIFVDPRQWWRHSGSLFRPSGRPSVTFWLKFFNMVISHQLSMGLLLNFTYSLMFLEKKKNLNCHFNRF